MKKLLITSVLATCLASGSVLADSATVQGDLGQIFAEKGNPTQVVALSGQEMRETEGAFYWVPFVYAATRTAPYWGPALTWGYNASPRLGTWWRN